MALYVYKIADGSLVSWSPDDNGQVASGSELAAKGYASVSGLASLDATHGWDAPTHSVVTVTAPKSAPSVVAFWKRFTGTEREAIEEQYLTGTIAVKRAIGAFFRYVNAAGFVDCNDAYVQAKVQQLETVGIIAAGRAAQILV